MGVSPAEALAGLAVLFLLPGFGLTAALFPERIRPARDRSLAAVEVVALSVIVSVSVTILLGELLQTAGPGFSASWSDPRLELLDLGLGLASLGVGAVRGAFRRSPEPASPGEAPADLGWETLRSFERLAAEERRIERSLKRDGLDAAERAGLERRRELIRAERQALRERREREYAS
jgi:hypothetical protein